MKNTIKLLLGLTMSILASQAVAVASPITNNGACNELVDLTTSLSCVGIYNPVNDTDIFDSFDFKEQYGYDDTWTLLSKMEIPDTIEGPVDIGLDLPFGQGTTSGTWLVNDTAWDGLVTGDIMAVLKAGTQAAAYQMNLDYTSGTWNVTSDAWLSGPNNTTLNSLSHFSFWTRAPVNVPEPSILALLGLGILGLGLGRRKMKK